MEIPSRREPIVGLQWPALQNPRRHEPIRPFWAELQASQRALAWHGRMLWRIHRRWHATRRAVRRGLSTLLEELAASPTKKLIDLLTGLPIALLVLPPFRDWVFRQPLGWLAFGLLVVVRVLLGVMRRGAIRAAVREEAGKALQRMLPLIDCTRIHVNARSAGHPLPPAQLQRDVAIALAVIADMTAQALQVANTVRLSANLMVPMMVRTPDGRSVAGCGIVAYNSIPASPSWTRLELGEFGGGRVFTTGKVHTVEDTTDPVWCGLFAGSRSQSFGSFPVRSGNADVLAVVNIDASHPAVFSRKLADALFADVLSAPLKLLGDLLVACGETAGNTREGQNATDS